MNRKTTFYLLMLNAGFMGGYTYLVRGGVFCNGQTGNLLLMGIQLGSGHWMKALYYLIPITAYILGVFLADIMPDDFPIHFPFCKQTCLLGLEIIVLLIAGFIPMSAPDQIVQILVNFTAAIQYHSFPAFNGISMATVFCSNHVRQIGANLAKCVRLRDFHPLHQAEVHLGMIACFITGAMAMALIAGSLVGQAIWLSLVPLSLVFLAHAQADLAAFHHQTTMPKTPSAS